MDGQQIDVKFGAQTAQLTQGINDVKAQLETLNAKVESISAGFAEGAKKIAEMFAVDKMMQFMEGAARLGDEVLKLSQLLGNTVEETSKLVNMFKVVGVSAESAGHTMAMFQRNMALGVENPASRQAQALKNLGVNLDEVKGKLDDGQALLEIMREAYQRLGNDANKTANFQAVFGLAFASNLPYLIKTTEEIEKLNSAIEKTGANMSTGMAQQFNETGDTLHLFHLALQGLGLTIASFIGPAFDYIIKKLTEATEWFTRNLRESSLLNSTFKIFIVTLDSLLAGLGALVLILQLLYETCAAVWNSIKAILETAVTFVWKLIKGDIEGAWNALKDGQKAVADEFKKRWGAMKQDATDFAADMHHLFANLQGGNLALPGEKYGPPAPKPKADPLKVGGHHAKGETTNYMQEWKQALQEQEVANNDFFKSAKATELAYWSEKRQWTRENEAKLIAELVASGMTQVQAKKRIKQLEFELDREVFMLKKEQANRQLGEYKAELDYQLSELKTQLQDKTISETEWYHRSIAINEQWLAKLRDIGMQDSAQYKEALKRKETIEREHFKNSQAEWASVFNWIDQRFTTMLQGVLMGTQTWQKALQNLFANMATSFIAEVAKMMLKWAAFQAMKAMGFGGIAKAIGNPLDALGGALGTMFGGAGRGSATPAGGAAGGVASAATNKALGALTSALGLNTTATGGNTDGILGWIEKQLVALAEMAGLTAATAANTVTTAVDTGVTEATSVPTMIESIAAMGTLTAATLMDAAAELTPLATGAWNLPGDMPAMLHKGEMVVPAVHAEALREGKGLNWGSSRSSSSGASSSSGGGGGGGDTHIYINAVDARSIQNLLRSNAPAVTGAIVHQIRNGDRTLTTAVRGNNK